MKSSVKQGARLTAALLVSAVGLVACGGGHHHDDSPGAAPPPVANEPPPAAGNSVPPSAGTSVAAYIAYIRGLRTDETSAPVNIGGFVAPVDDTAEPTPLS